MKKIFRAVKRRQLSYIIAALVLAGVAVFWRSAESSQGDNLSPKRQENADKRSDTTNPPSKSLKQRKSQRPPTLEEKIAQLTDVSPRTYISANGTLASELRQEFNLTDEEFKKLQEAVSTYWGEMLKHTAERMSYDKAASDASVDGAFVYRLTAMEPQERLEAVTKLKSSLDQVRGDSLSMEVIASLDSVSSFGYQGKYDMEFRFTPSISKVYDSTGNPTGETRTDPNDMFATFTASDPRSGLILSKGSSNGSALNGQYGHVFDFNH